MSNSETVISVKIIRMQDVMEMTGLSRSGIYERIADGGFPKQVSLGERSVGFVYGEVLEWLEQKMQARSKS